MGDADAEELGDLFVGAQLVHRRRRRWHLQGGKAVQTLQPRVVEQRRAVLARHRLRKGLVDAPRRRTRNVPPR